MDAQARKSDVRTGDVRNMAAIGINLDSTKMSEQYLKKR